jgi:hypothetical protein
MDANNNISLTWDQNDIFASNGLRVLTAADFQVVNLTPIVTGLSSDSAAPGSTITIDGQNFSGAGGRLSVLFGSTTASAVNVLSDTQVTALVPGGSGTVNITVQSGIDETDTNSDNPDANVNAPIYGYGVSAVTSAAQFTFSGATVWTGAADGINWSTPGNWSTDAVPTSASNVVIPSGATPQIGSGTFSVASLTLQGTATIDMNTGRLFMDYAGGIDPVATIAAALASGYNGGAWNGAGIDSSSVAAENSSQTALDYGVGYADGADGIATGVSSGQIEIMATLDGDAKLEGEVTFGDYQVMAEFFGSPGGWDKGNFTYAQLVHFADFELLAQNFGDVSSLSAEHGLPAAEPAVATAGNPPESNSTLNSLLDSSAGVLPIFSDQLLD